MKGLHRIYSGINIAIRKNDLGFILLYSTKGLILG